MLRWFLLALLLAFATTAAAQLEEVRVGELTPLDRQYMDRQRELIGDLSRRYYGRSCCRDAGELDLLQRLLDDNHVRPEQRQELQAMGVLLGDVLAAELDLDWVVYEDRVGRSRALRYAESNNYLFPITMISRRREAGNLEPVSEIYEAARDAMQAVIPPLPYQ